MPTLGLGGSGSGGPLGWNPARQRPRALWSWASGGDGTPAIPGGPAVLMPAARPGEHGHRRATGGAAVPARMVPWAGGAFPGVPGGGPGCFNVWDIGGCGCCGTGKCFPCALPARDLTLTDVAFGGATVTAPLVYRGDCLWRTPCSGPDGHGTYFVFTVSCTGPCVYFLYERKGIWPLCDHGTALCMAYVHPIPPPDCSGLTFPGSCGTLNLGPVSCSPLSIVMFWLQDRFIITP